MKKVLSILLSVMLILGTVTCLMLLPATANTGTTAPVNLIVNGDAEGGTYSETPEDYQYYKGSPIGWRICQIKDWQGAFCIDPSTDSNCRLGTFTNYTGNVLGVVQWQTIVQNVNLRADTYYMVTAKMACADFTSSTVPSGQYGQIFMTPAVSNSYTDDKPSGSDQSGKAWSVKKNYTYQTDGNNKYYCDDDFTEHSFVFSSNAFADANNIDRTSGTFDAAIALMSYSGGKLLVDDLTMYEVYTITAGEGGTVDTDGVPCGTTATIKATPYYGNTFAGWYNGATLVSSDATYTGVVNSNLTAKFNVYNQIKDGSFESGTTIGLEHLNQYHNTSNSISRKNTIVDDPSGNITLHNKVLHIEPTTYSGTTMYLLNIPAKVEKNKTYVLHFSYYVPGEKEFAYLGFDVTASHNAWENSTKLEKWSMFWKTESRDKTNNGWSGAGKTSESSVFHARTINSNIDINKEEWVDVWAVIETGSDASLFGISDTADAAFVFGVANNKLKDFYLDNVSVTEASSTVFDKLVVKGDENGTAEAVGKTLDSVFYLSYDFNDGAPNGSHYNQAMVAGSTQYAYMPYTFTYTAKANFGYVFDGWYNASDVKVSDNLTESFYTEGTYTAKFKKLNYSDAGVGDFESEVGLSGIVSTLNNKTTVSYGTYTDADKTLDGYTVSMGDKYLLVNKSSSEAVNGYLLDISLPFDIETGKKYLIHFKFRTITDNAPFKSDDVTKHESNRFDLQISGERTWGWLDPTGYSGKNLLSSQDYGKHPSDDNYMWVPDWFGKSSTTWSNRVDNYYDFYGYIDATNMTTSTIYVVMGIQRGATYAIDNISLVDLSTIAPTLDGASLAVQETADKVVYKTSVDLPEYLAMNKVTTYMVPTRALNDENATTFNADTANVSVASAAAATGEVLTENGKTFRTGSVFATFNGASTVTQTNNYSARSEVELTDVYGNSLGVTLATGNTITGDTNVTNGIHKRSIQQLKRVLAKQYIAKGGDYAAKANQLITTYTDSNKLYNGDITQVWDFVRAAYDIENQ